MGEPSLEKQPTESVTSSEEHEDHDRHEHRHSADHREHRGAVIVHLLAPFQARCAVVLGLAPMVREQLPDEVHGARGQHRAVPFARPALGL